MDGAWQSTGWVRRRGRVGKTRKGRLGQCGGAAGEGWEDGGGFSVDEVQGATGRSHIGEEYLAHLKKDKRKSK